MIFLAMAFKSQNVKVQVIIHGITWFKLLKNFATADDNNI